MTINGIWEWAIHVATKVPQEALRGKTLAIDGHIWLYESLKGSETHHQTTPNSYLITFFTRIQRLKELKVVPIVVFDSINANPTAQADNQEDFVPRKRRYIGNSHFTNLADHVYKTTVLLDHLAVKVIIAPGDGEAQCARLEELGATSGCITTDFDYFLFGGKNLYRVDFGEMHDVVHLSMGKMSVEKKISRPHLISTAILLGCDYFQRGVQGVGISTVFDILSEFGDNGDEEIDPQVILDRFVSYVKGEIPARSEDSQKKLKLRRRKFNFEDGFPNCDGVQSAIKMYHQPSVSDEIPREVTTVPNNKKVEEILTKQCGWSPERMQKEVSFSLKRTRNLTNLVTQTRIPEFFSTIKKKRFNPIVEQCDSIDDYISANATWIQKRRSSESPKNQKKEKNTKTTDITRRTRSSNLIHEKPAEVIVLSDSD